MTKAEIYRKAAEWVETCPWADQEFGGRPSCLALKDVGMVNNPAPWTPYHAMFSPGSDTDDCTAWGKEWSANYMDVRNCRVLALCFAAAMVEAGDL